MLRLSLALALAALAALGACDDSANVAVPLAGAKLPQSILRASVSSAGVQGNAAAFAPHVSTNGRYVVFESGATNLVPGDTNTVDDVFRHDAVTGQTTRVSLGMGGSEGDMLSYGANVSEFGRFVAFVSRATNLVPGDTNGVEDIFVRDVYTGTTTRVSVDSAGIEGALVSNELSMSPDGRWVHFLSLAPNLAPGDTNGQSDTFLHDRMLGTTMRTSLSSGGAQSVGGGVFPAIGAGGRFVAFGLGSDDLLAGDANGARDVARRDMQTGVTIAVSVDSGGVLGNFNSDQPSLSADGRFIAFHSVANTLVPGDANGATDVFVRDMVAGITTRASVDSAGVEGAAGGSLPSISGDGRFVVFKSTSPNLVPGDTNGVGDIFVHDNVTGITARVSLGVGGVQGNQGSSSASISLDGRYVAFRSSATNLVPGDTNGVFDVFLAPNPLY